MESLGKRFAALLLAAALVCGCGALPVSANDYLCPVCGTKVEIEVREATCTEYVYDRPYCPSCDWKLPDHISYGVPHPPLGHNFVDCVCTRCGLEDHDWKSYDVIEDCAKGGQTIRICQKCGEEAAPVRIPPQKHNYVCRETNVYTGYQRFECSVCGDTYEVTPSADTGAQTGGQSGSQTGSQSGTQSGSQSGTQSGSQSGTTCKTHTWKTATTAATCKEEGKVTRTCTVCGVEEVVQTLPKTNHKWKSEYKAPTCAAEGGTVQTCTVCGETQIVNPIAKLDHTYAVTDTRAAAMDSAGSRTYTCSVCGSSYTEAIPALGGSRESAVTRDPGAKAASSDNRNRNNYSSYASSVMTSFLYQRSDGNLTRVEAVEGGVAVEVYDPGFQLLTSKTVPMELTKFGGFYAGAGYNFLIFGQDNAGESNSVEVIRVVKYSKDWERLGAASLKGANTTVIFRSGSLRCAELNGYLYIRTSHQMYKSSDGKNHQANLTMAVRESDMEVVSASYGVSNIGTGYVSHSFNQFIIAASDGSLATLDHGDAYPRAAVSVRYTVGSDGKPAPKANVNLKEFPGAVGANNTDASFGGFEESSSCFLAAGNYGSGTRAAMIYAVDKSAFNSGSVKSYTLSSGPSYTPQLVKISDSRFLALWNTPGSGYYTDSLSYVFLDASGSPSGSVQTAKAYLSDCQPVLAGGKVVWYATDSSTPIFYTIDASTGAFASASAGGAAGTQTEANPFQDVAAGAYYYDAVLWALENGVTTGVTATRFEPSATCTRGQVVTFLWRAKGSPEPKTKTNPFKDVSSSSAFYKAILWAYENGITTGTTATTFNPGGTCTSGHVVTFLWRAEGQPSASGGSAIAAANPGRYYTSAVAWAESGGLLSGTGSGFKADSLSPRADIVTYLYRAAG